MSTYLSAFPEPSMEQLLLISSYALKDEAGREEKIKNIETKFYALQKMDMIACSYIFLASVKGKKMNVFAFFVTLPYFELSEFMPRFSLCEEKICQLLRKHLISKMENEHMKKVRSIMYGRKTCSNSLCMCGSLSCVYVNLSCLSHATISVSKEREAPWHFHP